MTALADHRRAMWVREWLRLTEADGHPIATGITAVALTDRPGPTDDDALTAQKH